MKVTSGMPALHDKITHELENVMKECADNIVHMTTDFMRCDLPKWESRWNTFFAEHDRTIKISPLLLLHEANGVLKALLSNLNEMQEAAMKEVTQVVDPLYREYLESYGRYNVEQIRSFGDMYYDIATRQMFNIIESYNRKTGNSIDARKIMAPYIRPIIIAYDVIIAPSCSMEIFATIKEWLSFPYTSTSVYKVAIAIKPLVFRRINDEISLAIEKEIREYVSDASREIKDRFDQADGAVGG